MFIIYLHTKLKTSGFNGSLLIATQPKEESRDVAMKFQE